jgi:hypothetical protein
VKKLVIPTGDIDRYRKSVAQGMFDKLTADLPRSIFIELCKLKFLFLLK